MDLTARQMLDRLIAFPTVSRNSNLELVDLIHMVSKAAVDISMALVEIALAAEFQMA